MMSAKTKIQPKIHTCNIYLSVSFVNDAAVALLAPDLIVVLNATWFVAFSLLENIEQSVR